MTENKEAGYGTIATEEPLTAVPMVEVTAPENLQEGYKFNAVYGGVEFPVIVPAGGCTKGQVLTVPFNPNASASGVLSGAWKDDILGCFRYGIFHPSVIVACCCPLVMLGQVMTRLKLNWKGNSVPDGEWKDTFKTMVYITVGYFFFNMILSPADPETEDPSFLYSLLGLCFTIFMIYLLTVVRKYVREKDQIPEKICNGCEDIVCAAFCGCCTVSQLARQTANYDTEEGQFFTPDGLPTPPTPVIIV